MKQTRNLVAIAISLLIFSACRKHDHMDHHDNGPGHVYTITNLAKYNSVLDYKRGTDGTLSFYKSYPTGGSGNGGGLGSQGAVVLTDNDFLLTVNAGSSSISAFKIKPNGLKLTSTINSGGEMPISIATYGPLVFALNAGGDGNISGFALDNAGMLHAIPNSTKPLSAPMPGPAQVSFVNSGKVLVITEKGTNKITTYTIGQYGVPETMHTLTSANATPFGFSIGQKGNIFVSEAAGGAAGASTLSSYHIGYNGEISLIQGPVSANQTAACWVAIPENGKYAYTTNTGSNNVSSFSINSYSGSISVLDAMAADAGMKPIDAAFSQNSKYLYVLNGGSNSISSYQTGSDGSLSALQTVTDLPESVVGLAAQ